MLKNVMLQLKIIDLMSKIDNKLLILIMIL